MIHQESEIVSLIRMVDEMPLPTSKKKPGHPNEYDERVFIKGTLLSHLGHADNIREFYLMLKQPSMKTLREELSIEGKFPSLATWYRRSQGLSYQLPQIIAELGKYLTTKIDPQKTLVRAVAMDSTVLRAKGGIWHHKDREAGKVPLKTIDTQANWTKSGWHGWVYGYKLHLATLVGQDYFLPLAAEVTPANSHDSEIAPDLSLSLSEQIRYVVGDRHYNTDFVKDWCAKDGRLVIASKYGRYPHTDDGVEVRRVFHKLRSIAIENFNEHFKAIFALHQQLPTKGLRSTKVFVLSAVLLYQLAVWYRLRAGEHPTRGLKLFLRCA